MRTRSAADTALDDFSGVVEDTGEGRWTVQTAIERAVPAMALTTALNARFRSRREQNYADKLISAMRQGFGGHVELKDKILMAGAGGHSANTAIVVMGVSGAGKTTIGTLLAARLGRAFLEGDSFHPQSNIVKMRSGVPLDDADRMPWLEAIAARDRCRAAGRPPTRRHLLGVETDVPRHARGQPRRCLFVYLRGGRSLVAGRLASRAGHFMPPQLLESQFAALQEPDAGEASIVVDIEDAPERIVQRIADSLAADVRA